MQTAVAACSHKQLKRTTAVLEKHNKKIEIHLELLVVLLLPCLPIQLRVPTAANL
jgi:hypothetical protein